MNLTEILKNVPRGTKMHSPLFKEPITFERIASNSRFPIICKTSVGENINFTAKGYFSVETATQNCMIFPTPEMTWSGYEYIPEGSLVICKRNNKITQVACSKGGWYDDTCISSHWWYDFEDDKLYSETFGLFWYDAIPTSEEIATIDKLLAEKGYLFVNQKLERTTTFKKGDIIVSDTGIIALFDSVREGSKPNVIVYQAIRRTGGKVVVKTDVGIGYTHEARLATRADKEIFLAALDEAGYYIDGDTVKRKRYQFTPFEKVLVRDNDADSWRCALFSHIDESFPFYKYRCIGNSYDQCIPYNNDTAHLVGKFDPAPEKYQ